MSKSYLKSVKKRSKSNYGKEVGKKIYLDTKSNLDSLIKENPNDSKDLRKHTYDRIYPALSYYKALLSNGISKEDAVNEVHALYRQRSNKAASKLKKIFKLPGLAKKAVPFFKKMMPKMFTKECGYEYELYPTSKTVFKVDVKKCPYLDICKKYNSKEIATSFCESDDICYGSLHKCLYWKRDYTLARGGEVCDFYIEYKKDKKSK